MLFDALSKDKEVVIELLLLNVKNIVIDQHEIFDSLGEFIENGHNIGGHCLTAGVTDLNLLELMEL